MIKRVKSSSAGPRKSIFVPRFPSAGRQRLRDPCPSATKALIAITVSFQKSYKGKVSGLFLSRERNRPLKYNNEGLLDGGEAALILLIGSIHICERLADRCRAIHHPLNTVIHCLVDSGWPLSV